MNPIGFYYGEANYKYDVPRQGCLFAHHLGRIEFNKGMNFETALRDLGGFERIWVIFLFHKNSGWRPTTRPPIASSDRKRIGVFASRSPYRPNPIGMSCVKLLRVDGLCLYVDESDLLNETPILDIKPYIPMSDAFPYAKAGWVDFQPKEMWKIKYTERFVFQNQWLKKHSQFDLLAFAQVQLCNNPLDSTRHRIEILKADSIAILSYRTFRIEFKYDVILKEIILLRIFSGYSQYELTQLEDKYGDKTLHKEFLKI